MKVEPGIIHVEGGDIRCSDLLDGYYLHVPGAVAGDTYVSMKKEELTELEAAIPRWISVEQPPDVKNKGHVWCHVCLKDGHVTYGQYSQAFGFRVLVTMEIAGEYRLAETDEVARWTPLPAPSVENNDA